MLERQLQRLLEARIEFVPADLSSYFVLTRDGYVCLVERSRTEPPGFGPIGSVCKLTEQGFAVVTWNGAQAYFTLKDQRQQATPEEVATFRRFAADVRAALAET